MLYTILSIIAFLSIVALAFSLPMAVGTLATVLLFEQLKQGHELHL